MCVDVFNRVRKQRASGFFKLPIQHLLSASKSKVIVRFYGSAVQHA